MVLTNKQEQGLKIALERYRNNEAYTCIAGFAGVGKTTLIRFIISALELDPNSVIYCAYTGKAAMVLKRHGNEGAMTCHRLLYYSKQKPDGTFFHVPKPSLPAGTKLVVVDEVSMVPKHIWDLLLSHGIHVIACGDPFQLPPIGENNGVLDHPHIFLDEVMRQAQESEIIRLSMDIRAGRKPVKPFRGTEINIVSKRDECQGMYSWADQIICGKNNTRFLINSQYRRDILGYEDDDPVIGDKIICLKNNGDIVSGLGDALINGMIGTIDSVEIGWNPYFTNSCVIGFTPEDCEFPYGFRDVSIDYKLLTEGEESITKENFRWIPKKEHPEKFNYGYAITCHKSQGSEYNKVLLIEEILNYDMHLRWLYTGVTRAKEKLTLVLNH